MRFAALRWTALLVLLAGCAQGEQQTALADDPSRQAQSDPATWNTYLRAAAAADRIEDVVERCHSYPDLPGNHWPVDSGRARCGRLADALPTLAEIESLLADEDGVARLEGDFAQRLEAHYRDPLQRESIFRAYQDFSSDDDSRRVAELWLARSPASGFARMAMGRYLVTAAGEARGDKRIAETPDANLQTMRRLMAQGVAMLQAALEAQPRLSPACVDLMFAARLAGDDALRDSATARCLATDPLSWSVRFQWLMQKDPRWGGSFEELDAAIDEMRPLVPRNPALGAMLARGIGLRAYLSYLNDVSLRDLSAAFDRASQVGPDPLFIGYAGLAAKDQGDLHKALGYLSQGLRFAPGDSRFLGARADVRMKLQDFDGAAADARRAIELDDSLGRNHTVLGQSLAKFGRVEEAREAYLRAMQFPKQRQWAFRRWCETYILGGVHRDEALACTQDMVSEYPNDTEALFLRSRVLYELKDPAAAEVAARFRAVADMNDRRQQQMASELARIAK